MDTEEKTERLIIFISEANFILILTPLWLPLTWVSASFNQTMFNYIERLMDDYERVSSPKSERIE